MPDRLAKLANVTAHIVETVLMVILVVCFVARFLAQFWINEGRAVIRFGDHEGVYVEPARPGDETVAHIPLMVMRRCLPLPEMSMRHVMQGDIELSSIIAGGVPEMGPVGEVNDEFEMTTIVPEELEPGHAVFFWTFEWDCGLRRVTTQTPLAMMEVLPPVR